MDTSTQVRFGPAGWSYPDWEGPVYQGAGRGALELLATVFDTVEVNSTFYRPPSPRIADGWLRKVSVNPDFRFTAKLWRGFTHERDFGPGDVRAYRVGISPLVEAGRLGALLAQFPWSYKQDEVARDHVARLKELIPDAPLVLEVRHESWNRTETLEMLEKLEVSFCNIDQPLHAGSIPPTAHVTGEPGYVRLHGRNRANWFRAGAGRDARYDYLYSTTELEPWRERLAGIARSAGSVYVVTNNHFGGSAVVNALELGHAWDGRRLEVPDHWLTSFPRLARCCRPRGGGQLELFADGGA